MRRPKYDVLPPEDPFAEEWQRAAEHVAALLTPPPADDRQLLRCTCTHCSFVAFVRSGVAVHHGFPLCPSGVPMRPEKALTGRKKRG